MKTSVPESYTESLQSGQAASRYRASTIVSLLSELEGVAEQNRIIDVGCGLGVLLKMLQQFGFSDVLGVEAIPSVVDRLHEEEIPAVLGDVEQGVPSVLDGTADVVVCSEVLEHLYDPACALGEMRRWLRPAGWLVVSVPNAYRLGQRLRMLAGRPITDVSVVGGHIKHFHWDTLPAMVEGEGFRVERRFGLGWGRMKERLPGYDRLLSWLPGVFGAWIFVAARKRDDSRVRGV